MEMYLRGSKKKSSFNITGTLKTFPQKWTCINVVRKKNQLLTESGTAGGSPVGTGAINPL